VPVKDEAGFLEMLGLKQEDAPTKPLNEDQGSLFSMQG